jgi:hypothetical protein
MSGHKRTKVERENDLARIADLHADGLSQREIAELIGVSQVQICKDLKEIYVRWAETEPPKKLAVTKGRLLTEIALNKKIMKQAWRDSLKPKETVAKKQVSTPGPVVGAGEAAQQQPDRERNEATLKTEDRDGNVSFMREVREYITLELDGHGLRKKAVEISGAEDGPPIRFINICRPASIPPPAPLGSDQPASPEADASPPPAIPKLT